jgi:hypothetical protein
MNRRMIGFVGAALIALPLAWSPAAWAQRSGSTGPSSSGATPPAGSTGSGINPSSDNLANGSNASVGNSSGTAAAQGWPHAGHVKRDNASRSPGEKAATRSTR